MEASGGDRTDEWRYSYSTVRKDLLVRSEVSNRRRLAILGAALLPTDRPWLDLGAGDGNLTKALWDLGARCIVAVEYQTELLEGCDERAQPVTGSADRLPLKDGSIIVAVAMDVLHHLTSAQIDRTMAELRRVLVPGGRLLVCEPAPTLLRSVLGMALMSPLSSVSAFSRDKRRMVELEAETLVPWLECEPGFARRVTDEGFELESTVRRPLHTMRRFAKR